MYGYFEVGTEALIVPYLEGGVILALPIGLKLECGLHFTVEIEFAETYEEINTNIYPLI